MPTRIVGYYFRVSNLFEDRHTKATLRDTFIDIYTNNKWGGCQGEYFSGSGSIDSSVNNYARTIKEFIIQKNIKQVIDLGCGDFRVGRQLLIPMVNYICIDIVPDLVEHNKKIYNIENVTFLCLNIVEDELPDAELCLIRQVLQHLSNYEILQILKKCRKYKYIIATEHLLPANMIKFKNRDKIHGADTRLKYNSGVYLDKPPFSLEYPFASFRYLLDQKIDEPSLFEGERLVTLLIEQVS
jgi:hypothetical protein